MGVKKSRKMNINDALTNIEHDLIFEFRFISEGIATYQSVVPYSFTGNEDVVYVSIDFKYKKSFNIFKTMELAEIEDNADIISIGEVFNTLTNQINKNK